MAVPNVSKPKRSSQMEMDSNLMFLQAKIQMLEIENNALKEENDTLKKERESAVEIVEHLKTEMLLMKETKKDEVVKHQLEISKIRKTRDRSFSFARKVQNITECKIAEAERAKTVEIGKIERAAADKMKATVEKYEQIAKDNHKEIRTWKDKLQQVEKDNHKEIRVWTKKFQQLEKDYSSKVMVHELQHNLAEIRKMLTSMLPTKIQELKSEPLATDKRSST